MKIGKQPKSWKAGQGKPTKSTLAPSGSMAGAASVFPDWNTEPEETQPIIEADPIRVYLDDERPCPEGWTLCRTPREFIQLVEKSDPEVQAKITHLSLDWNLGMNQADGVEIARRLVMCFLDGDYDDKPFLPNLRRIGLHSSDRDAAARMYKELNEALVHIKRDDKIRIGRNTPTF